MHTLQKSNDCAQTFPSDPIGDPLSVHQGGSSWGQQDDVLHVSPGQVRAGQRGSGQHTDMDNTLCDFSEWHMQ